MLVAPVAPHSPAGARGLDAAHHAAGTDSPRVSLSPLCCCCSEAAPEPVPTPPPARRAATLSVGQLTAVVYTQDGKRVTSREGGLGDTLFQADKLGTGQSVEVRQAAGARGGWEGSRERLGACECKAHVG